MRALLGYNRKLGWVVIPAFLWACLGLSLAMGTGRGAAPPFAVHVGMPVGSTVVPGRVMRVVETEDSLQLSMGILAEHQQQIQQWQQEYAGKLPDNLAVEFVVLDRSEIRPSTPPEYQLLDPDSEPRQFPGQRHVVLTNEYILLILPREARVLPRGRDSEAALHRLLEERRGRERGPDWQRRDGTEPAPPGPGNNQDDQLERRRQRRGQNGEGVYPPPSEQPGAPPAAPPSGEQGPPPERPGGPPQGHPGPPPERPGNGQGRGSSGESEPQPR